MDFSSLFLYLSTIVLILDLVIWVLFLFQYRGKSISIGAVLMLLQIVLTFVTMYLGDRHFSVNLISTVERFFLLTSLGVIGMKVFAQGFIFDKKRDGLRTVWEALTYSLSQPVSTVIVGMGSVAQLEENVAIAKSFIPLSAAQQKLVESKTKSNIRRACFFRKEFGGYNSRNRLAQPD